MKLTIMIAVLVLAASSLLGQEPFESKYPNGKTRELGTLFNGKRQGEWKFYYASGKINGIMSYKDDLPHGRWVLYHENGKLEAEEYWREGVQD
ncbi:MAG TPA: hypothetical protein VL947_12975, partial [Cytophagales bacterium]|nr:hypothetical protein [Cytophagales bacterium]